MVYALVVVLISKLSSTHTHNLHQRYLKLQEARYGISKAIKELRDNALKPLDEVMEFEKIEIFRDDVVSNCCGAPITEYDDISRSGRCSKCKENCVADERGTV
jgi:hypothetical protein